MLPVKKVCLLNITYKCLEETDIITIVNAIHFPAEDLDIRMQVKKLNINGQ